MARPVVQGPLRGHFHRNGQPKNGYPSEGEALAAMRKMKHDPTVKGPKSLNVFQCGVCDLWHVGHRGRAPS